METPGGVCERAVAGRRPAFAPVEPAVFTLGVMRKLALLLEDAEAIGGRVEVHVARRARWPGA